MHLLSVDVLRTLVVDVPGDPAGPWAPTALAAASGLVRLGEQLFVVADDELQLARFDLANGQPGTLTPLFDGQLPHQHDARKAAKPDCEALLVLPAFAECVHGALMALGSGSRASRQRAALVALDMAGNVAQPARSFDLSPLFERLHGSIPSLNVEGAFVRRDRFCLLQRGNGSAGGAVALNACIDLSWPAMQAWLAGTGPAPAPQAIMPFELGELDGVRLSFTDGAALPDGGWLFSAAAEATVDSYADGACAGSAVGRVDAAGRLVSLRRLSLRCKVEGIAATVVGQHIELLMVTDADDRRQPALLLSALLPY